MIEFTQSAFMCSLHNRSYWLPFVISPSLLPPAIHSHYNLWLFFEVIGHILTEIFAIIFVFVSWKVKAMHINMNILTTYTMGLVQINMLTRLILIVVEISGNMDDISDVIITVCLIKTFVWVGLYNYVTFVAFERYAALLFSSDYEKNRRVWVSAFLILGNSIFSAFVAFLLVYNYMNGIFYVVLTFFASNISCMAFMLINTENIKEDQRLSSFNFRGKNYTVSLRWQVKDNVRLSKETRFLVFGSAVQISFYLPFFFIPPLFLGDSPEWRATLEFSKALFQLICAYGFAFAELFVIFAFSRHRDYIKSIMGYTDAINSASTVVNRATAQTHIESLREQWNR